LKQAYDYWQNQPDLNCFVIGSEDFLGLLVTNASKWSEDTHHLRGFEFAQRHFPKAMQLQQILVCESKSRSPPQWVES